MAKNKCTIILIGPPGAGKGTQAELLSDKLGFYHFETSKVLEKEFREAEESPKNLKERFIKVGDKKYDLMEEYKMWKTGILCSPPFVAYLVKKEIKELFGRGESLVMSGSPRTLFEGKEITPLLKKLYGAENIKVLFIEISPKETIFRNSHRRICELIRHPILYNKETVKLTMCPLDGSKLVRRKNLDDPETIKVRLKEFKERTFPLIECFKRQGIEIKKINGEQTVANVFKDILNTIQ